MPVVFLTPFSDQGLLQAQHKTFPTGNTVMASYNVHACIIWAVVQVCQLNEQLVIEFHPEWTLSRFIT